MGDAPAEPRAEERGMQNAFARALEGLTVIDIERIRAGCGHVRVPSAPAARGYRYLDLAGDDPPFYVHRLAAGRLTGSVILNAPIEATSGDTGPHLAAFVHVPPLKRDGTSQRKQATRRVTLEELVDAGEAMLLEMVRLTRQAVRERSTPVVIS